MDRTNKHYTKDEISVLKENYGKISLREMCVKLGRNHQSIQGKIRRLGLANKFPLRGSLNGNWKGGYTRMGGGYLKNNKTEKLLHREVVEKAIARTLDPKEIVHHIDGDSTNNSIINLYLCKGISEHRKIHWSLEKIALSMVKTGQVVFDKELGEYRLRAFGY